MGNKRWPQQGVFAERVRGFCTANGYLTKRGAIKMDVVADMFNLHEDTLRQFLQNTSRSRPHVNTLSFIAGVLGCSVAEFLDAPTDPPPPIPLERWEGLSERERALVVSLISEIASDDLSISEREELFKDFQHLKARMIKLRELWKASASEDS